MKYLLENILEAADFNNMKRYEVVDELLPVGWELIDVKAISPKKLSKGMIVGVLTGTRRSPYVFVARFLGVSGTDQKYGKGGPKYSSFKDVFREYGVNSLKELQKVEDEIEGEKGYGHSFYAWLEDIEDKRKGPWVYLYNGRLVIGSNADPVSFYKVKKQR